ncbi:MAG: CoA transferase [Chloroflexi bacterium]|nr:CoA transferase [Chloroflexota bacterium]
MSPLQRENLPGESMVLRDVTVLELGEGVGLGYCGRLLAGYGADVIKVERPGAGDGARYVGPFPKGVPHSESSGLFLYLNTNKKSITLDVEKADGQHLLERIVPHIEIILDGLPPGKRASLGLSYEQLKVLKPSLIMTSVAPFGQTGPYKDFQATEIVIWALSGYHHLTGDPDREPLKGWGNQAHYQAGVQAALATVSALFLRDVTGEGQWIDVSVAESLAVHNGSSLQSTLYGGAVAKRRGNKGGDNYPNTILPASDGHVQLHFGAGGLRQVAELMGEPRLADPKWDDHPISHADELDQLMLPWLQRRTKFQAVAEAQAAHIPFVEVLSPAEVMQDEQNQARSYFLASDHPYAGRVTYPGSPVRLPACPWENARAPLLGEHNREVYVDRLGLSPRELAILSAEGIV